MGRIEVVRESKDRLSDQVWHFWISSSQVAGDAVVLRLSYYAKRSRKTTRHKMVEEARWDRMDQRRYHSGINASDVPCPEDVWAEAHNQIRIVRIGATP